MGGKRKATNKDSKSKKVAARGISRLKVWQQVLMLIAVVGLTTLFIGAVAGWFEQKKVAIDEEYYCSEECDGEYLDIDASEYDKLVGEKKSFVVLIDQGGCKTADRLREYAREYSKEAGVRVYRMMFEEMKKTQLHDNVKYYPSVVLVSKGSPVVWLRADEDEDADEYNDYDSFKKWMKEYL